MSQVSYGTITITDTTDIHTYIRYAKQVPLLSVSDFQSIPDEDTRYIAVYSGILTECPAWDSNVWDNLWVDFVGTDGVSVLGVKEIYFLKRTSDPIPTTPGDNINITDTTGNPGRWTTVIPQYIEGAQYYSCIQTDLSDGTYVHSVAAINQNLIESSEAAVVMRATQQHFWFNAEDIVDEDGTTVLTESGAYITDTPIDDFKESKTGGYLLARSDGLVLGKDSNKDAILNSDGLITKSGGIIAGESGSDGYVYLSTHDYPLKDTSDPSNPINGLTINNHTPTAEGTDDKTVDDPAWREVIGTKFGVDSEGNLYAAGAHIDGDIIAQSLTIGSGANAYDGMAAINISGYSIEIVIENIEDDDEHVYLYPHLYHNGIEERVSDYTRFLWYENNNEIAIIGEETNYGRILASRSNSYRVTYEFDDGEVGSGTPIETIKVEPTEYITNIDNIGIKVHPKQWSTNSNYLQIDGNGVYIKDSSDIGLAEFTALNARIGKSESTHFMINTDSLQAFNELGNKYFEVNEEGLTWGSNTAATTTQVNNAALTASNYITDISNSGIRIHSIEGVNSIVLNADGTEIFKGGTENSNSVAFYGDTARIGKEEEGHLVITNESISIRNNTIELAQFGEQITIGNNDRLQDGATFIEIDSDSFRVLLTHGVVVAPPSTIAEFGKAFGDMQETIKNNSNTTWYYKLSAEPIADTDIRVAGHIGGTNFTIGSFVGGTASTVTRTQGSLSYDGADTFTWTPNTEGVTVDDPEMGEIILHGGGGTLYIDSVYYTTAVASGGYACIGSRSIGFKYNANTATVGEELVADEQCQVAIGRYNFTKNDSGNSLNYAFMIGNGSSDTGRSNALAIDWRGRIHNNNSNGTSWISGRDEAKIQFHPTISGVSEMHPYISMKTNVGAWQISTYQNNALYFAYTTDANYSSGTNSATGAYITIAGAYTNMSDRKIKKNISSINNAKEFIMQLKPVQFNFKDIENDKLHMGFIAQEVAEAGSVINDDLAVYTANYKNSSAHKEELITAETDDEELSWSLCYSELIAPLVQTVQEQQKEIDQLKDMIKNGGNNGEKSS